MNAENEPDKHRGAIRESAGNYLNLMIERNKKGLLVTTAKTATLAGIACFITSIGALISGNKELSFVAGIAAYVALETGYFARKSTDVPASRRNVG